MRSTTPTAGACVCTQYVSLILWVVIFVTAESTMKITKISTPQKLPAMLYYCFYLVLQIHVYTILLVVLFQLKYMYKSQSSPFIRLSRNLKMAQPNLYGWYLAVAKMLCCKEKLDVARRLASLLTVHQAQNHINICHQKLNFFVMHVDCDRGLCMFNNSSCKLEVIRRKWGLIVDCRYQDSNVE